MSAIMRHKAESLAAFEQFSMSSKHQPTSESSYRDRVELTRAGIPVAHAEVLRREWEIPVALFATILGVSERKWSRARAEGAGATLGTVESDRLIRLREIFQHSLKVFDQPSHAAKWFKLGNRALSGESPISLMDTDAGAREVEAVLTRLEFGVYA